MAGPGYPNQQLANVSLEFVFKGRFAIYATLAQLQDRYAERFDTVLVPNAQFGTSPALQPFWLRSSANSDSLLVALNQVSYQTERYAGHDTFVATAVPLLSDALVLSGTKPERVQYRYRNLIGLGRRDDGTIALDAVLQHDRIQAMFLTSCTQVHIDTKEKFDDGAELASQLVVDAGDVLKLDLTGIAHVASDDVVAAIKRAHHLASSRFEDLICEAFREELRGTKEGGDDDGPST